MKKLVLLFSAVFVSLFLISIVSAQGYGHPDNDADGYLVINDCNDNPLTDPTAPWMIPPCGSLTGIGGMDFPWSDRILRRR